MEYNITVTYPKTKFFERVNRECEISYIGKRILEPNTHFHEIPDIYLAGLFPNGLIMSTLGLFIGKDKGPIPVQKIFKCLPEGKNINEVGRLSFSLCGKINLDVIENFAREMFHEAFRKVKEIYPNEDFEVYFETHRKIILMAENSLGKIFERIPVTDDDIRWVDVPKQSKAFYRLLAKGKVGLYKLDCQAMEKLIAT